MKERLKKKYGTLRAASIKTHINYYRLSQIVNGWIRPSDSEYSILEISKRELKATLKEGV